MKHLFAKLLSVVGISRPDGKGQEVQTLDPSKILFSVPTIADDLGPVEKVDLPLPDNTFTLHEDDWCLVEFHSATHLHELKRMLTEYKAFEAKNRTSSGWKNVYVRRMERTPVIVGSGGLERLSSLLGTTADDAPVLHSTTALTGRVRQGFSMTLGGNIRLYGYVSNEGLPVLAASVGEHPDDHVLTSAFAKLHKEAGLILVDWKNQFILVGVSDGGQIEIWKP